MIGLIALNILTWAYSIAGLFYDGLFRNIRIGQGEISMKLSHLAPYLFMTGWTLFSLVALLYLVWRAGNLTLGN